MIVGWEQSVGGKQLKVGLGNFRVGVQDKITMCEHATGVVTHDRLCLNCEVA